MSTEKIPEKTIATLSKLLNRKITNPPAFADWPEAVKNAQDELAACRRVVTVNAGAVIRLSEEFAIAGGVDPTTEISRLNDAATKAKIRGDELELIVPALQRRAEEARSSASAAQIVAERKALVASIRALEKQSESLDQAADTRIDDVKQIAIGAHRLVMGLRDRSGMVGMVNTKLLRDVLDQREKALLTGQEPLPSVARIVHEVTATALRDFDECHAPVAEAAE